MGGDAHEEGQFRSLVNFPFDGAAIDQVQVQASDHESV